MINSNVKSPRLDVDFQQQYAMSFVKLNAMYNQLNSATFLQSAEGFYKDDPLNYIISIRAYPFIVNKLYHNATLSKLFIGGVEFVSVNFARILRNKKGLYKVGEFEFNANYDFLDYSPYTRITAYLPYINNVNLPVNECIGCKIEFWYAIDTYTGNTTCYIYNATKDYVILNAFGKIGIDINLGGSSAYERNRNLLTTGLGVMGGSISGSPNVYSAISTAFSGGASIMNAMRENVSRGSISDGVNALSISQKVTLIFETPITKTIDYEEFKGRPLFETKTLNTLDGYTQCEEVHFIPYTTTPTSAEIDEIESLLRSGVIIHS